MTSDADKIMSNKKHNESLITDERTLMRRAWIDLALNSVRSQLNFGVAEDREAVETIAAGYEAATPELATDKRRSRLYLAYSAGKVRTRVGS